MKQVYWFWILILSSVICRATEVRKISGRVLCSEKGLPGVVVTDGVNFAVTDKKGGYNIQCDTACRFVYVSVPSGYTVPVEKGRVLFFQVLEKNKKVYDFTLIKKEKEDVHHGFIVTADPQVWARKEFKQLEKAAEDIRQTVESYGGTPFHGLCVGDIIHNDPAFYGQYNEVMERTGLDFYNCMGNHDMKFYGRSFETSLSAYEKVYGPAYYSFNVGQVHYVVLNDNFYVGRDWYYIGYLEEKQLRWLEQDLSYIPEGSAVVLMLHIPTMYKDKERLPFSYEMAERSLCNYQGLYKILQPYKVHIVSGHMHTTGNYAIRPGLYEHNIAAISGAWWQGELCTDGTPRGYGVFEVLGDSLIWYYKATGHDREYQLRIYDGRMYPQFKGYIVANVWNSDSSWKVEMYEDGLSRGQMERFVATDPAASAMYADKDKLDHKWIQATPSEHYYRAMPSVDAIDIEVVVTDRFGRVYRQKLVREKK